jgi:hypothetical protein
MTTELFDLFQLRVFPVQGENVWECSSFPLVEYIPKGTELYGIYNKYHLKLPYKTWN